MKFLQELNEARMLINSQMLKKYSAEDVADITFLHLLTLEMFRKEFHTRDWARQYALETYRKGFFNYFKPASTDLYNLLYVVTNSDSISAKELHNSEDSEDLLKEIHVDAITVRWYLKMVAGLAEPNEGWIRRFFFQLQSKLLITDDHYRAIRQLVLHYDTRNSYRKQLIVTRLLMAFRHRAQRSDMRPQLEQFAKKQKLEMKGELCNPETGRGCEPKEEPMQQKQGKQPNKAAWQAADNFAAGLAVGWLATRNKEGKNAGQRNPKRR